MIENRAPHTFPRRILLATVGLVPQVVTETLFALIRQQTPAFVPTEVHIVTTLEGCERTRLMLLDPSRAMLARFAEEFEVPDVATALILERIHVIKDDDGAELSDITSEAGNRATANLITQQVRELTADPQSALHVSIAGGRKTMGFLLGTALSIFGRPQDRLSHVLIEPPQLEQHPKFFYPPRVPVVLQDTREPNRPIDTREARVTLAEIPFVRLRHGLPQKMLDGDWSYSETVEHAQDLVRVPELIIDRSNGLVSCGGINVPLTPVQFAFYAWLAERRLTLNAQAGVHHTETPPSDLIRAHAGVAGLQPQTIEELWNDTKNGYIPDKLIEQRKTRINKVLTASLGQKDTPYHVVSVGLIEGTQYRRQGLLLDPIEISFATIEALPDNED